MNILYFSTIKRLNFIPSLKMFELLTLVIYSHLITKSLIHVTLKTKVIFTFVYEHFIYFSIHNYIFPVYIPNQKCFEVLVLVILTW